MQRVDLGHVDRWLEASGFFVALERFTVAFESIVNSAFADIGIGQRYIQCDRLVEAGQRLIQPAELLEGCSFLHVRAGVAVVQGQHFIEADHGAGGLFQVEKRFSRGQ